jgi:CBS domain-containing protein
VSPRAASRLESIGFTRVHDYVGGKADWGSFGLPLEGRRPSSSRVGAHVRTDAPVCRPDARMSDVRARVRAARWDTCVVADEHGVVLGRLLRAALAADDDVSAEEAMTPGPSTVRPSYELEAALERLRTLELTSLLVTRSDGVLVGVLRREDAEAAARAAAAAGSS